MRYSPGILSEQAPGTEAGSGFHQGKKFREIAGGYPSQEPQGRGS